MQAEGQGTLRWVEDAAETHPKCMRGQETPFLKMTRSSRSLIDDPLVFFPLTLKKTY